MDPTVPEKARQCFSLGRSGHLRSSTVKSHFPQICCCLTNYLTQSFSRGCNILSLKFKSGCNLMDSCCVCKSTVPCVSCLNVLSAQSQMAFSASNQMWTESSLFQNKSVSATYHAFGTFIHNVLGTIHPDTFLPSPRPPCPCRRGFPPIHCKTFILCRNNKVCV